MSDTTPKPAFVTLASDEEVDRQLPPGGRNPYDFGFRPAMTRLLLTHPELGQTFRAHYANVMFKPGALSRPEREMVAAVAAAAQDCFYWTQSHAEFLRVEGGAGPLVEGVKAGQWRDVAGLTPRERALGEVAEKLSAQPTRMTEADWAPLRELGFTDQALLEVAHIVGLFNYLTRLADGMGLQLDGPTLEASRTGVALKRPQ